MKTSEINLENWRIECEKKLSGKMVLNDNKVITQKDPYFELGKDDYFGFNFVF